MGNVVTDYRKARAALRLGAYETWLVECIAKLLRRHDDRLSLSRNSPGGHPAGNGRD